MRHLRLTILFCLVAVPCLGWSGEPGKPFQIMGVVVSRRDGAPVPYARLTAVAVPGGNAVVVRPSTTTRAAAAGTASGSATAAVTPVPPTRQPDARPAATAPRMPVQNPEATADASGHFALSVPHGGGWRLTASARGFYQQGYDAQDGFFAAVVLSDAEPVYNLTFKLTPDALLTGLIYDEAGEPVEQAQVVAELVPAPVPGVSSVAATERPRQVGFAQSDDRGHYEISGLAPGKYRLRVQAQPWYANGMRGGMMVVRSQNGQPAAPSPDPSLDFVYPATWFPGTDDEAAAEPILLAPGEERQADMHLTAIPAVHLKVPRADTAADDPPQGANGRGRQAQQPQQQRQATVVRVSADGAGFGSMTTSPGMNGEWDFGGLSPGTYEVHLPGPDGRQDGEVRQISVKSGGQTVITLDGAKPLVRVEVAIDGVQDGQNIGVEFIDTETGRRIPATIPQRGRRGAGGGMVHVDGPPGLRDADDAGDPPSKVRFAMLPPHEYEVHLTGVAGNYLTGISAPSAKIQGRTIAIDAATTVTVHVAFGRGRVEGVVRRDGKALEGAMVLIVPATLGQPGNLSPVARDESNTDGTFLIASLIPGRYILVAIDQGWTVDWRKPETLAQYLLHGVPVEVNPSAKVYEELEAVGR